MRWKNPFPKPLGFLRLFRRLAGGLDGCRSYRLFWGWFLLCDQFARQYRGLGDVLLLQFAAPARR